MKKDDCWNLVGGLCHQTSAVWQRSLSWNHGTLLADVYPGVEYSYDISRHDDRVGRVQFIHRPHASSHGNWSWGNGSRSDASPLFRKITEWDIYRNYSHGLHGVCPLVSLECDLWLKPWIHSHLHTAIFLLFSLPGLSFRRGI